MSIKITFKVHTHLLIHKNLSRLYRDGNSIQDIDRLLRGKTVDIGADKGLTPVQGHSTTWTNPDLMCKLALGDATQEEWRQTRLLHQNISSDWHFVLQRKILFTYGKKMHFTLLDKKLHVQLQLYCISIFLGGAWWRTDVFWYMQLCWYVEMSFIMQTTRWYIIQVTVGNVCCYQVWLTFLPNACGLICKLWN